MEHPEAWSFGRYKLRDVEIRGLTYFRIGQPPWAVPKSIDKPTAGGVRFSGALPCLVTFENAAVLP